MDAPDKKPRLAAAVAKAAQAPYTQRTDRKRGTMTGGAHDDRISDLDGKLAEGLNLVHGQLAGLAEDIREDRREFRAGFARLDARVDRLETRMDERFAAQEAARKADTEELKAMIRDLSGHVRRVTEQSATALERSTGLAWMRRRLAAGMLLLLAGGLLAEIGRLALGAFLGR